MNIRIFSSTLTLMLTSAALVASSLLWTPAARADACVWEGSEDTSWANAANWSCDRVPGPADDVTIAGEVEISTATTVGSLTLKTFADVSSPSPSQVITVSGDFTWTGGYLGTGVTVRGQTTVEGDEDKIIRGRGRLTTANESEGLRVSGTGVLLIDTDNGVIGLTSPSALLEDGAHVRSSGCCSSVRSWDVTDLRVAGDAHVVDLKVLLGFASVAQGATLSIAGGLLDIKELPTGSSRAFGDVNGYQGGRMVVGAPVPGGFASEATDVTLPALVRLADLTWEHLGGSMYTRTKAVVEGPVSGTAGTLEWTGGALAGDLTVGRGAQSVALDIRSANGDDLYLADAGGGKVGALTVGHRATLHDGTRVMMSSRSRIQVGGAATFLQEPGSTVAASTCCSSQPAVVNDGTWSTPAGSAPARLDSVATTGFGTWDVGLGTLAFAGEVTTSIRALKITVGDGAHGFVSAAHRIRIDHVVADPVAGYTPTVGATYRIIEAQPPEIRDWTVKAPPLANGLGLHIQSAGADAINLVVKKVLDLTLACQQCAQSTGRTATASWRLSLNSGTFASTTALTVSFSTMAKDIRLLHATGTGIGECKQVGFTSTMKCKVSVAELIRRGSLTWSVPVQMPGRTSEPTVRVFARLEANAPLFGTTSASVQLTQVVKFGCEPSTCRTSARAGRGADLKWVIRSPFDTPTLVYGTFEMGQGQALSALSGWICEGSRTVTCQVRVGQGSTVTVGVRFTARRPGTYTVSGQSGRWGALPSFLVRLDP